MMLSINPNRSIVSLAVVAGLLAAAGPASAQGGGAGPVKDGLHLGRGVDGITADAGAGDDRVRASGLKAGSSEVLTGTVTARTRPEVGGEALPGNAFGSGARSFVVEKDLNQPDMGACRDYTDDPLTVNNQRVVLESDFVRQPRSCKWELSEFDA